MESIIQTMNEPIIQTMDGGKYLEKCCNFPSDLENHSYEI